MNTKLEYLYFLLLRRPPRSIRTGHSYPTRRSSYLFELMLACMIGDGKAWKEMEEYNIVDTLSVRDVYHAMRPWIRNHANLAVHIEADTVVCTKCGGNHLHRRGYAYTTVGKYARYQCVDCGDRKSTRLNSSH